ncbi:hypothetical protein AB0F91_43675 [Amycolatopsis sp. NPDC023774]|uniref:hypothetical protein n=1 Tax=Amycolatopsis sp. NPDC023774 TaxID=3155015 RepID=UPI0033CA52FA
MLTAIAVTEPPTSTGGALHLAGLALLIWSVSRGAAGARLGPRPAWRAGLVIAPLLAVSLGSIVLLPLTRLEPLWRLLAAVWICWVCAGGLIGAASRSAGNTAARHDLTNTQRDVHLRTRPR